LLVFSPVAYLATAGQEMPANSGEEVMGEEKGYEPLRSHPSFLKPHMHCGNGA